MNTVGLIRKLFAFIAFSLTIFLMLQIVEFRNFKAANETRALSQAEATMTEFKTEVQTLLEQVEKKATELGDTFSRDELTKQQIETLIRDNIDYSGIISSSASD